jgi:hypothetical protein
VKLIPPEIYDADVANDAKLEVDAYELDIPDPPPFIAYDALSAYDADVAVNALPLSDPVNPAVDIVDPVTVNPLVNKIEPLKYDAVTANDAQLDVPMNEPLKDPVLI